MSEWIEYTGSDEQLKELLTTKSKFMVDNNKWSVFHKPTTLNMPATEDNLNWLAALLRDTKVKNYLICQPHPYADLIDIWRLSGCPVYAKHKATGQTDEVCGPRVDWNHEEWEFSLTPFED